MDSISSNDMVKYVIVIGLVYTILKLVPSQDLSNKDLLLIILVIAFGLVCVDCFVFKKTEAFADALGLVPNVPKLADVKTGLGVVPKLTDVKTGLGVVPTVAPKLPDFSKLVLPAATMAPSPKATMAPMAPSPKATMAPSPKATMAPTPKATMAPSPKATMAPSPKATMAPTSSCGVEVAKVKRDLELKINQLTEQLNMKQPIDSSSMIASKYYSSLINELNERGVLDVNEIQNIKLKLDSKLLSIDEVILSLEKLKATSKVKPSKSDTKSDHKYDELPSEFYSPMGGNIANNWDNQYTILDTNRWQVPMPRPPVCINTAPCKVCPSESGYFPVVTTKDWDQSRKVSDTKINKDWANAQMPSNK